MSLLARLIEAGTPADLIEEVAMMIAEKRAAEKAMEEARAKARDRTERYRGRFDVTNAEWIRLRALVFERDNFECVYCRSDVDLACDHVTPLIQGGKSSLDNLVTACRRCNSAKAGRTPEEWRA